METEKHRRQSFVLTESLELAWAGRNDVYVGADMFMYFSALQIKKNDFRGPDVYVVLNTVRRIRKSWVVWQENGRTPDVIIELVSETTEHIDRGEKMRIYARLGVENYYIFDPDPECLRLDGFGLNAHGEYTPLVRDAQGDFPCPALGLRLGIRHGSAQGYEDEWLRWIDERGNVLPTQEERAQAAEEQARNAQEQARNAQEQALHEARLRSDADRRLAEALAEIERLKAR